MGDSVDTEVVTTVEKLKLNVKFHLYTLHGVVQC